jgi:predicted RNA binding protein YcfA (HicA-like mRNA interferase family)
MGKKKDLNALRTSREFIAWAEKHGGEIKRGKGSHVHVRKKGIMTTIPAHDIATGTRRAIIKAFIAMGMGIFIVAMLFQWLF